MADEASEEADDEALLYRILVDREEGALLLLLARYLPRALGRLRVRFRGILTEHEFEELRQEIALKVWRSIGTYDDAKASLKAWFYGVAYHAAVDIVRHEAGRRLAPLEIDPWYEPDDCDDASEPTPGSEKLARRAVRDMLELIEGLTSPLQRAIMKEDMVAGGTANSVRLAQILGSTLNSIDSNRSKARATIRKQMAERGHIPDGQRRRR